MTLGFCHFTGAPSVVLILARSQVPSSQINLSKFGSDGQEFLFRGAAHTLVPADVTTVLRESVTVAQAHRPGEL